MRISYGHDNAEYLKKSCRNFWGVILLTLYKPKYEDLWFRQMMLADEDTMSYNHAWGGTIPWPEDQWKDWYDHWIVDHNGKRYYRYLKNQYGQYLIRVIDELKEEVNSDTFRK